MNNNKKDLNLTAGSCHIHTYTVKLARPHDRSRPVFAVGPDILAHLTRSLPGGLGLQIAKKLLPRPTRCFDTLTPEAAGIRTPSVGLENYRHLISRFFSVRIIGGTVSTPRNSNNRKLPASGGYTSLTDSCKDRKNRKLPPGNSC